MELRIKDNLLKEKDFTLSQEVQPRQNSVYGRFSCKNSQVNYSFNGFKPKPVSLFTDSMFVMHERSSFRESTKHIKINYHFIRESFRVFHESTKHIEINYHFIKEKVLEEIIKPEYLYFKEQTADMFIKPLHPLQIKFLLNKSNIKSIKIIHV